MFTGDYVVYFVRKIENLRFKAVFATAVGSLDNGRAQFLWDVSGSHADYPVKYGSARALSIVTKWLMRMYSSSSLFSTAVSAPSLFFSRSSLTCA